MRIDLNLTEAANIKKARMAKGFSQYQLAEQLGWVRSKVKRIEKFEVSTIERADLESLWRVLDGSFVKGCKTEEVQQELSFCAASKSSSDMGEEPERKICRPVREGVAEDLFTNVYFVPRRMGVNQAFFKVTMKKGMKPDQLLRTKVAILGYEGVVHGVENDTMQDPLRAGDQVILMLWGEGILRQQASTKASLA